MYTLRSVYGKSKLLLTCTMPASLSSCVFWLNKSFLIGFFTWQLQIILYGTSNLINEVNLPTCNILFYIFESEP